MTIALSDHSPRESYTVTQGATQTAFTVPFEFFDDADLNFYVDGTKKTLTTHYTVSGGNGSTGTINTTTGNTVTGATGGSTVVITRSIALNRTTDFPSSGAFEVSKLNTELDRFTAIADDITDTLTRTIQLADEDTSVSTELPLVANRKGTVLGFNASTGAVEAGPTITAVQSLADVTTSINLLGTSAVVEDMGLLATSAVIEDMGLLATSANVTAMGLLGTSANVTAMGLLGTSAVVADMALLATSDVISDLNTLASSDFVSDLNAIEAIKADVTTVADNVAGVNSFAERYRVASSDPSSSLNAGDLAFNTSSNVLKYYNGSSWQAISAVTTGISSGNVFVATSGIADDDFLRVSGTSVEGRSASEVATDIGAATVDEATALAIAL